MHIEGDRETLVRSGLLVFEPGENGATTVPEFVDRMKNYFLLDRDIYFPEPPRISGIDGKTIYPYKIEMPLGRRQEVVAKMMEIMSDLGIALRI